jgi:hypothetical protein
LVLAERVLSYVVARRAARIDGESVSVARFGVEAAPHGGTTPEWDILRSDDVTLVLEEAKSGAVEAADRDALWRRTRSTVARLAEEGHARPLNVRLVVNAGALPRHPDRWRELPRTSQQVEGRWTTQKKDGRRRSVKSADDLANEALHILSSTDPDAGPPMSLEAARELLSRFLFDETYDRPSIEGEVRRLLDALDLSVGVDVLVKQLRGEIATRAESEDRAHRTFTAEELLRSFKLLERLAGEEPRTLGIWRELCLTANANAAGHDQRSDGLTYQDWEAVQPTAAEALRGERAGAVAVVGPGGIGKSVLLRRWLMERRDVGDQCLLLKTEDLLATPPSEISTALDLGAFAARHHCRPLVVGVDGLENAPPDQRRLLLSALHARAGVSVCVTSRALQWNELWKIGEASSTWTVVHLTEWPESRVRLQVNRSNRPRVGEDLLRLLRTPLFLDLFLRTFGHDVAVPPALQTKHGLIKAYWDRRVLPENDERSADRRMVLMKIAEEEAAGIHAHTVGEDAARGLTSEGLLVLAGGDRSFRHALLRDFAMMEWATHPPNRPEDIVRKVEQIEPELLRFGTLQATLQAEDVRMTSEIVGILRPPTLFEAATAIGDFEDPSHIDLVDLLDRLSIELQVGVAQALLTAIKLGKNTAWVPVLARLPNDPSWADRTHWLTADSFLQLVQTLNAMSLEQNISLAGEMASRLRTWSTAPELFAEFTRGDFALALLTSLLAKIDPSPETVSWLGRIVGVGESTRFWTLSELPKLVRGLVARSLSVDDAALRTIYCTAAGYREEDGRLREDASAPRSGIGDYERIDHALIGDSGADGLIAIKPSTFVRIAIDLIAGHEADEAEQFEQSLARQLVTLGDVGPILDFPTTDDDKELEEAQEIAGSRLAFKDALGELVGDAWGIPYPDQERTGLLQHLRNLAEKSLSANSFFGEFYWPSVIHGKSALARVCALDLLTRGASCPRPAMLDELLQDGRLYFLHSAQYYLQRGIRMRWASLSREERRRVLENIQRCGRKPAGSVYRPGPLLSAIPQGDRPVDLQVFVTLLQQRGWKLELEEARSARVFSGNDDLAPTRQPWTPIVGVSEEDQEPWRRLFAWESNSILRADGNGWSEIVEVVEVLVGGGLPAPQSFLAREDGLLQRMQAFSRAHATRIAEDDTRLTTESLRTFAEWSIRALRAFPPGEVTASCDPVEGPTVGLPPRADLWLSFAQLADALLRDRELKANAALHARLFCAINAVTKLSPRLSSKVLDRVQGWFRANATGKPVLWALLTGRTGDGLSIGLRFLEAFEREEQHRLLRTWLLTDLQPKLSSERTFAQHAGRHVGWAAMVRYEGTGETTGSHDIIHELIAAPSSAGVLSDPSLHSVFVREIVFGAKQVVAGGVPFARAYDFARLMESCWQTLSATAEEEGSKDTQSFALWVFGWLFKAGRVATPEFPQEDRVRWWRALRKLALSIVNTGPPRDVRWFFDQIEGSPILRAIGATDVLPLMEALNDRTDELTQVSMGVHWREAISSASAVIESTFADTDDASLRNDLYGFVRGWACPPLAVERAAVAARQMRGATAR